MNAKNYAEVLLDGKIYTLAGSEDEQYLQQVASYINDKVSQLRRQERFSKQSQDYQAVMVELNIADDYFKAREEAFTAKKQSDEMEKETYSLKHELVTTQMKLDAALRELEMAKEMAKEVEKKKPESADEELKALKEENQKLRAIQAAHANMGRVGNQNNKK